MSQAYPNLFEDIGITITIMFEITYSIVNPVLKRLSLFIITYLKLILCQISYKKRLICRIGDTLLNDC